MSLVAFLDASVLYPATRRSVLMYLAAADVFRPLWSDAVNREWMQALARDRPDLSATAVARTKALMEAHVDHPLVTGYEGLIPSLTLPDPNDGHVLAAAIHGEASMIVTHNLKHFPASALAPHKVAAVHPDDFVLRLIGADPGNVVAALATDRARLKNPSMSAAEYLTSLERAGLFHTAAALKAFKDAL